MTAERGDVFFTVGGGASSLFCSQLYGICSIFTDI